MTPAVGPSDVARDTQVLVRYWASARAATGVAEDRFDVTGEVSAADVLRWAGERHPEARRALGVCSVLVDDRPLGSADASAVVVRPGQTVELLPPFAGG